MDAMYDPRFGAPRTCTEADRPAVASKSCGSECEADQAAREIYEEWMQPVRSVCKTFLQVSENVSDGAAAVSTLFLGKIAALEHIDLIEQNFKDSLLRGNSGAARHHLKREARFAVWTLGYDDTKTQQLLNTLEIIQPR